MCRESICGVHNWYYICGIKIEFAISYCFLTFGIIILYLVFVSCFYSYRMVFAFLFWYSRKTWTPKLSFSEGESWEWARVGTFSLFRPNRLCITYKSYKHQYFPRGRLSAPICRNAISWSGSTFCFRFKACVCDNLWWYIAPARAEPRHFAVDGDRIIRSSISSRAFLWPVSLWRNHGNRKPTTYLESTRDVQYAEREKFFGYGLFVIFCLNLGGVTSCSENRDLLLEFRVGGFLAKMQICPVWCSNAERIVIHLSPFDLREKSRKILRKHPSTECAFQISTLCLTYYAHTLHITLVPYTHSNICCMRCISYVLLRM